MATAAAMLGLRLMPLAVLGVVHAAPSVPVGGAVPSLGAVKSSTTAISSAGGLPTDSILHHDPIFLATALAIVGHALSEQNAANTSEGAEPAVPGAAAEGTLAENGAFVEEGIALASDIVAALGKSAFPDGAPIGQGLELASDIVAKVGQGISPADSSVDVAQETAVSSSTESAEESILEHTSTTTQGPVTNLDLEQTTTPTVTEKQTPAVSAPGGHQIVAQTTLPVALIKAGQTPSPLSFIQTTPFVAPFGTQPTLQGLRTFSTVGQAVLPAAGGLGAALQVTYVGATGPVASASAPGPVTVSSEGQTIATSGVLSSAGQPTLPAPVSHQTATVGSRDSLQFDVATVLAAARLGAQHAAEHHEAAHRAAERQLTVQQAEAQQVKVQQEAELSVLQQIAALSAPHQVTVQKAAGGHSAQQQITEQGGLQVTGQVTAQQNGAEVTAEQRDKLFDTAERQGAEQATEQTVELQTIPQQSALPTQEVDQQEAVERQPELQSGQTVTQQEIAQQEEYRQAAVTDGSTGETVGHLLVGQLTGQQESVAEQPSANQKTSSQSLSTEQTVGAQENGNLPENVHTVEDSISAQTNQAASEAVQLLEKHTTDIPYDNVQQGDASIVTPTKADSSESNPLSEEQTPGQIGVVSTVDGRSEVQQAGVHLGEDQSVHQQTHAGSGEVQLEQQEVSQQSDAALSSEVSPSAEEPALEQPDTDVSISKQQSVASRERAEIRRVKLGTFLSKFGPHRRFKLVKVPRGGDTRATQPEVVTPDSTSSTVQPTTGLSNTRKFKRVRLVSGPGGTLQQRVGHLDTASNSDDGLRQGTNGRQQSPAPSDELGTRKTQRIGKRRPSSRRTNRQRSGGRTPKTNSYANFYPWTEGNVGRRNASKASRGNQFRTRFSNINASRFADRFSVRNSNRRNIFTNLHGERFNKYGTVINNGARFSGARYALGNNGVHGLHYFNGF